MSFTYDSVSVAHVEQVGHTFAAGLLMLVPSLCWMEQRIHCSLNIYEILTKSHGEISLGKKKKH